jgi:hypothetical protein
MTSWSFSGMEIKGPYSNYVLQKTMDTAPATVAQDLMVLLRYGDKGIVIAQTTNLVQSFSTYESFRKLAGSQIDYLAFSPSVC